mmetsp:Transcript_6584/g.8138  ORF Transcript_6584/g.8138 Transcript_6584/m.8138 type:complete len:82 (+) Transcript_6584:218-463(+)
MLGGMWRNLSQEQKEKYIERQKRNSRRHSKTVRHPVPPTITKTALPAKYTRDTKLPCRMHFSDGICGAKLSGDYDPVAETG